MFFSGVQSGFRLDSRLKHAGMTDFGWGIYLTQHAAGNRPTEIESYEVISHQFLLISLNKKCAWPLVCSSRSSVMPSSLPFLENSLCASSTSSGLATCRVNRFASDK